MKQEGRALRGVVALLVFGGLVFPILAGVMQTARAAFGVMPAMAEFSVNSSVSARKC